MYIYHCNIIQMFEMFCSYNNNFNDKKRKKNRKKFDFIELRKNKN